MSILKNAFEAVRKAVFPTAEESAERDRAWKIDSLELELEYAKLGFKAADPYYAVMDVYFGMAPVPVLPVFDQADWTKEEREQAVQDIITRLKDLGVSGERLDHLELHGIPSRQVILNYKNGEQPSTLGF
jgi:nucleotide-binding universal stress UspA family protein